MKLMKIIAVMLLASISKAAGVTINGNQINSATAIRISTLTVTGSQGIVSFGTATVKGVTDGSSAAAGFVGEFISTAPTGNIVPAATGTFMSIATTTLTAGDWDVDATAYFQVGSVLTAVGAYACISTTANGCDSVIYSARLNSPLTTAIDWTLRPYVRRMNVTTNTPLYLTVSLGYTANTGGVWQANGTQMRARRIR